MEKYVISAELDLPNNRSGIVVNPAQIDNFRADLTQNLREIGKDPLWVESQILQQGMESAIGKTALSVVSLDNRYVRNAADYLGISRAVYNEKQEGIDYYANRTGFENISEQFDRIARQFRKIVLADDVIFSGENMRYVIQELARRGVDVQGIIAGITIDAGAQKLAETGIPIESIATFDTVDDEICERDFAFVPDSGRIGSDYRCNDSYGVLYFDDLFGAPTKYASIPRDAKADFCQRSLVRNIQLLRADAQYNRQVYGRRFAGYNGYGNQTAIDALKERIEFSKRTEALRSKKES